eukprot:TRINITY_DN5872_c0_g1_i2.p1 TRINITY_DN5872_c0_g1~~TRINITY_DN5872_c0_g1_i2.p1  ORF type:complete len:112 (-),score=23.87 TRINITY_DN5872_c0_g1_i2:111-446(-)
MLRSLVGSEMCIRDRSLTCECRVVIGQGLVCILASSSPRSRAPRYTQSEACLGGIVGTNLSCLLGDLHHNRHQCIACKTCLLYTSDAADEEDSVDLGGRRIIKKKKKKDTV